MKNKKTDDKKLNMAQSQELVSNNDQQFSFAYTKAIEREIKTNQDEIDRLTEQLQNIKIAYQSSVEEYNDVTGIRALFNREELLTTLSKTLEDLEKEEQLINKSIRVIQQQNEGLQKKLKRRKLLEKINTISQHINKVFDRLSNSSKESEIMALQTIMKDLQSEKSKLTKDLKRSTTTGLFQKFTKLADDLFKQFAKAG